MAAPRVIAFDVIETLFALDKLRPRIAEAGLAEGDLEALFASLLRDAFALQATGTFRPFKDIAASALTELDVPQARHAAVFEGFGELDAHPDVRPAFEMLAERDVPVLCLTNGAPGNTDRLLDRNGLSDLVARTISIEEIGTWKPSARVYTYAAEAMGVAPAEMALVACHPWDCQGALAAGCMAGYVTRGRPYGPAMTAPQAQGDTLPQVVEALLAL